LVSVLRWALCPPSS